MEILEYTGKEEDKITDFSDFEKLSPCIRYNVLHFVYYQSIDAIQENKESQVSECDYQISKYGFSCKYDYDDKIIISLNPDYIDDDIVAETLEKNEPFEFDSLDHIDYALSCNTFSDNEKSIIREYIDFYKDKIQPYIEKCLSILPTYDDEYMLKLWMDNGIFLDREGNFYGSDGTAW